MSPTPGAQGAVTPLTASIELSTSGARNAAVHRAQTRGSQDTASRSWHGEPAQPPDQIQIHTRPCTVLYCVLCSARHQSKISTNNASPCSNQGQFLSHTVMISSHLQIVDTCQIVKYFWSKRVRNVTPNLSWAGLIEPNRVKSINRINWPQAHVSYFSMIPIATSYWGPVSLN